MPKATKIKKKNSKSRIKETKKTQKKTAKPALRLKETNKASVKISKIYVPNYININYFNNYRF